MPQRAARACAGALHVARRRPRAAPRAGQRRHALDMHVRAQVDGRTGRGWDASAPPGIIYGFNTCARATEGRAQRPATRPPAAAGLGNTTPPHAQLELSSREARRKSPMMRAATRHTLAATLQWGVHVTAPPHQNNHGIKPRYLERSTKRTHTAPAPPQERRPNLPLTLQRARRQAPLPKQRDAFSRCPGAGVQPPLHAPPLARPGPLVEGPLVLPPDLLLLLGREVVLRGAAVGGGVASVSSVCAGAWRGEAAARAAGRGLARQQQHGCHTAPTAGTARFARPGARAPGQAPGRPRAAARQAAPLRAAPQAAHLDVERLPDLLGRLACGRRRAGGCSGRAPRPGGPAAAAHPGAPRCAAHP
jgi:hypothetical protein